MKKKPLVALASILAMTSLVGCDSKSKKDSDSKTEAVELSTDVKDEDVPAIDGYATFLIQNLKSHNFIDTL